MKNAQLTLLADPQPWHLDEHTRKVGREGVARARAALAAHIDTPTDDQADHQLAA